MAAEGGGFVLPTAEDVARAIAAAMDGRWHTRGVEDESQEFWVKSNAFDAPVPVVHGDGSCSVFLSCEGMVAHPRGLFQVLVRPLVEDVEEGS